MRHQEGLEGRLSGGVLDTLSDTQGTAQLSGTPVPGDPMPSDLSAHLCAHASNKYMQAHVHK